MNMVRTNRRVWAGLATFLLGMTVLTGVHRAEEADLPIARAETVGMSSKRLERVRAFMQD